MKKSQLVLVVSSVAVATLGLLNLARNAQAQSGSRIMRQSQPRRDVAKQAHYDVLWSWLQRSDYKKWDGVNGKAPEFQKGKSPHGAWIKTYLNKTAARDIKNLPVGSVIIKENYSPDKKLKVITAMQRSKGYDAEHGNWYYAKYMPNGKIARTPPKMKSIPIAGKFPTCIECHSTADGNDFVFLND